MSSEAQPASNIELQAQHTQQPDPQGSSRVPPSIWEDLDAQEAALDAEMAELSSLIEAQDNEFKELSRRAEELNMGVLKNARRSAFLSLADTKRKGFRCFSTVMWYSLYYLECSELRMAYLGSY